MTQRVNSVTHQSSDHLKRTAPGCQDLSSKPDETMPGPSNSRKSKGKSRGKGSKRPSGNLPRPAPVDQCKGGHKYPSPSSSPSLPSSPSLRTPSPLDKEIVTSFEGFSLEAHIPQKVEQVMFQPPFIHDPGNGPRVRDPRIFMSSFFAKPAALDVRQLLSLCILSILTYFPLAGSTLCGIRSGRGSANVVHGASRRNCTGLF